MVVGDYLVPRKIQGDLKMKIRIISEQGSIEGWFVALCESALVYGLWVVGLFSEPVAKGWEKTGGFIQTIYLGTFGTWLFYRGAKAVVETVYGKPSSPEAPKGTGE